MFDFLPSELRTIDSLSVTPQNGLAQHDGEYVNVFHDLAYIRNRWSKYFEVVTILPSYIYTHDLVVLRK